MAKHRNKSEEKQIVLERLDILFRLAEDEAVKGNTGKASEMVASAVKLSTRYNTPIPREYRQRICKHCKSYFTSSNSMRRLNPGHKRVEVKCLDCGRKTFITYGHAR
ncbi:MAG: hypothetical protein ABIH11_00075 [Candidatus Altiarchaeota archaeon]